MGGEENVVPAGRVTALEWAESVYSSPRFQDPLVPNP